MRYRGRDVLKSSIIAAALALSLVVPAWGGTVTLQTTTLQGGVDADVANMQCEAVNVGKKSIGGTFEFLGVTGQVIQTTNFAVDPGATAIVAYTSASSFTVRCRITFTGSKKSIMGAMKLLDAKFNTISVVPAR